MAIDLQHPSTDLTASDARPIAPRHGLPLTLALIAVTVAAVIAGILSLELASAAPAIARPLVDAPSGWTAIAILLVWATRQRRPLSTALLGVAAFIGLNVGWYVVGGGAGSTTAAFWFAVAAVAGPVVGVASGGLHDRGMQGAVGGGVLAGIMFGDAVISTQMIGNITAVGGAAIVSLGGALLIATVLHVRGLPARALALTGAAATTLAYCAAWGALLLVA